MWAKEGLPSTVSLWAQWGNGHGDGTHQVVLLYLCYCIYTLVRLKGRWVRQAGPSPGAPLGADTAGGRSLIPPPFLPPAAPPPRDNCHGKGRGLRAGSEVAPLDGPCAVSPARAWAAGSLGWLSPWSGSARQTPTRRLQAKSRRGEGETATPLMSPRGRAQVRAQPGPVCLRPPSCLGLVRERPEAPGPLGPLAGRLRVHPTHCPVPWPEPSARGHSSTLRCSGPRSRVPAWGRGTR